MTPFNQFLKFIQDREQVRIMKEAGGPPPWTQDPILQTYSFCNVQREHDKVTRWLALNWRGAHATDPDLWFAMAVARHVNLPATLAEMGYPVPWKRKVFVDVIRGRRANKLTAYNGAYMIRASSADEWQDKAHYLAEAVLSQLWKRRETLRPKTGETLEAVHQRLEASFGLGSFMAAQIIADVKYVSPLREAADWWDFAASGPGSRRGLNRVLGRGPKDRWTEQNWREELAKLRTQLRDHFQVMGLPRLHAQDVQNCLCEFDKYVRTLNGEGRPKRKYRYEGLLRA